MDRVEPESIVGLGLTRFGGDPEAFTTMFHNSRNSARLRV
jgi:hypothetical protein